jgi:hypothetical protein
VLNKWLLAYWEIKTLFFFKIYDMNFKGYDLKH